MQQQRRRRLGSGSDGSGSRRSSRDVDTLTDEDELLLELNGGDAPATPATLIVTSSTSQPPASGIVEEIVEENPFAGEAACRGSTWLGSVSRGLWNVLVPRFLLRVWWAWWWWSVPDFERSAVVVVT